MSRKSSDAQLSATAAPAESGLDDVAVSTVPPAATESLETVIPAPPVAPTSVSLPALFRFSTPSELCLGALGLLLAIVSGAAHPVMTIVFGQLTQSFTDWGILSKEVTANLEPSEELLQAFAAAGEAVKRDASRNAVYLVIIGIAQGLCAYFYMVVWNYVGEANSRRLRQAYLDAVLRQEIAYFDEIGAGEVATRIENDCHLVQDGTSEKVAHCFYYTSTFASALIIGLVRSWRLALVLSTCVLVIMGTVVPWVHFAHKWYIDMYGHFAEAGTLAEEVLGSIRTVKAFGSEKQLGERFAEVVEKARRIGRRLTLMESAALPILYAVSWLVYSCTFFYGGILVTQGHADVGIIINVFFAIIIGSFAFAQISEQYTAVNKGRSAASKLFATIDRVPLIDSSAPIGLQPDTCAGDIAFQDVSFTYASRANVPVLQGFEMTFPPGQSVALVGASGSGKSTVVALIERFYDPIKGRVILDGRDIRELNVQWLRRQIGLVSQEPTLFDTTVRQNIEHGLIGSPSAHLSPAERFELVKQACIAANAHDFICSLPQGYDTPVGARGMLLSGGQKQRVAIARAIVSNPRILLLDEATSALDAQSEGVVQDALDKAAKGRTTIIVAHRLATVRDCDKIVVMGPSGRVLDVGTHAELYERKGVYHDLVEAQKLKEEESATRQKLMDGIETLQDRSNGANGHAHGQSEVEEEYADGKWDDKDLEKADPTIPGLNGDAGAVRAGPGGSESGRKDKPIGLGKTLVRMLGINRADSHLYVLGLVGGVAHGMAYPACAILFGLALEDFQITDVWELRDALRWKATWFFIASIATVFVSCAQVYGFSMSGFNLSSKLRVASLGAMMRHDVQWFDEEENSVGALTSGLATLPTMVQGLFGRTLGALIYAATTVIGGSIIGLCYAPLLALIGILTLPLLLAGGFIRLHVVVLKDAKTKKIHEKSAHLAAEATAAVKTVAALTREGDVGRMYAEKLGECMRISIKTSFTSQALYGISSSLIFFIIALIYYVGTLWLVSGRYTVGEFYIVLTAVVFATSEVSHLFSHVPDASKAKGAGASILEWIDYRPSIESSSLSDLVSPSEEEKSRTLSGTLSGHIKLENVSFTYPSRPSIQVLSGLSLDIPAGSFVALVGHSGCGKSTTIQLLERFYDPTHGRITVNGRDVREWPVQELRNEMALVSQEPTLYAGTVGFNIRLGARAGEEVSQGDVERACREANIYDFITSLPDGFETQVGGKGSQLSGGQKQRIALARALLRKPNILLLDEATSALDSQSERVVQAALDAAAKGRTTISVAHRLSTIQHADKIYYFEAGRVKEEGTHEELLTLRGGYFDLVQLQRLSGTE